jgi:hypothetical protein
MMVRRLLRFALLLSIMCSLLVSTEARSFKPLVEQITPDQGDTPPLSKQEPSPPVPEWAVDSDGPQERDYWQARLLSLKLILARLLTMSLVP